MLNITKHFITCDILQRLRGDRLQVLKLCHLRRVLPAGFNMILNKRLESSYHDSFPLTIAAYKRLEIIKKLTKKRAHRII